MAGNHLFENCVGCARLLRRPNRSLLPGLCLPCSDLVPWILTPYCHRCGRQLKKREGHLPSSAVDKRYLCRGCVRAGVRHFEFSRGAVAYTPQMKSWLALYKYRGDERLGPLLGAMAEHAYGLLLRELRRTGDCIHVVTYVPLSFRRLRERSFNQAERIAAGLARKHGLPLLPLLDRVRHTTKQSRLSRPSRISGIRRAFAIHPGLRSNGKICCFPDGLVGKSGWPLGILLVDDVYTTGSTMDSCAETLRQALSCRVYGLTWAR